MRCISPILVRQSGRRDFVPCGKCNFCLETKRSDWTFRLLNEKKDSLSSYFLTFTYSDESIPKSDVGLSTLWKRDVQLFTKRLRKQNAEVCDWPLRYYTVGEYGTLTSRPHYHSVMFNLHSSLVNDLPVIWGKGHFKIGTVETASIHYVAKYVINRVGEYSGREPPFALMSKRPGIGARYTRTHAEWHKSGLRNYTKENGIVSRLPRYYKDKFFNAHERALLAADAVNHSTEAYLAEVERLSAFHEDPFYYYEERACVHHEKVTSKINDKNKF